MTRTLICWIALVLLLVVELIAAHAGGMVVVGVLAAIMVLVVAIGFMQIRQAPPLARIFAIGGVVWLVILLALGSMDSFTRTDYPVHGTVVGTQ
jgi:hypothetical protein